MHKREDQPASHPTGSSKKTAIVKGDLDERVSPAEVRAADAVVHRATRGLMRLEFRRRMRHLLRRLMWLSLAAVLLGGLWYYFGDYFPTARISEYWDELNSRVTDGLSTR